MGIVCSSLEKVLMELAGCAVMWADEIRYFKMVSTGGFLTGEERILLRPGWGVGDEWKWRLLFSRFLRPLGARKPLDCDAVKSYRYGDSILTNKEIRICVWNHEFRCRLVFRWENDGRNTAQSFACMPPKSGIHHQWITEVRQYLSMKPSLFEISRSGLSITFFHASASLANIDSNRWCARWVSLTWVGAQWSAPGERRTTLRPDPWRPLRFQRRVSRRRWPKIMFFGYHDRCP